MRSIEVCLNGEAGGHLHLSEQTSSAVWSQAAAYKVLESTSCHWIPHHWTEKTKKATRIISFLDITNLRLVVMDDCS